MSLNKPIKDVVYYLSLTLILACCQNSEQEHQLLHIPSPPNNPTTASGVALGKALFFEKALSASGNLSCADCHSPQHAYASNARTAAFHHPDATNLNVPPLFNLAWHEVYFYNGGGKNLESAVLMPLINSNELAGDFQHIIPKLNQKSQYKTLCKKAFGVDTLNSALVGKALAQFVRSITSFNSKADTFFTSKDSSLLSTVELQGFKIYQQHCSTCHPYPLFTDLQFHRVIDYKNDDFPDLRRALITRKDSDAGKVKTPSLRNLSYTWPYGHTGKFNHLSDVILAHQIPQIQFLSDSLRMHALLQFIHAINGNIK